MITTLFWVFFGATLAALAAAVITGRTRRRRLHLCVAPTALVLLLIAILLAEQMASVREFPAHVMRVHLPCAKVAGLLAIATAVSGLVLWRTGRGRAVHRLAVVLFLSAALVASGTGVWAFSGSVER